MTPEEFDRLLSRLEGDVRRAFLDAVRRLGDRIDVDRLAALLEAGRTQEALDVVNAQLVVAGLRPVATQLTYSTVLAAATEAGTMRELVRHDIVFDQTETEALDYLRRNEMRLIKETGAKALASVRTVITQGQAKGRNPRQVARDVRQFIGLTDRQAQAVMNYRGYLENGQQEALERALRDKRFDGSVQNAILNDKPLSQAQIDKLTDRYRDRYLNYRATTIARTEALRAANGGAQLAWQQQVKEGKIEAQSVRRDWIYTHDARTRQAHREIPLLNPDGVGLNQPFDSSLGPIMMPGDPAADPENTIQCRCHVLYRTAAVALREAA